MIALVCRVDKCSTTGMLITPKRAWPEIHPATHQGFSREESEFYIRESYLRLRMNRTMIVSEFFARVPMGQIIAILLQG